MNVNLFSVATEMHVNLAVSWSRATYCHLPVLTRVHWWALHQHPQFVHCFCSCPLSTSAACLSFLRAGREERITDALRFSAIKARAINTLNLSPNRVQWRSTNGRGGGWGGQTNARQFRHSEAGTFHSFATVSASGNGATRALTTKRCVCTSRQRTNPHDDIGVTLRQSSLACALCRQKLHAGRKPWSCGGLTCYRYPLEPLSVRIKTIARYSGPKC